MGELADWSKNWLVDNIEVIVWRPGGVFEIGGCIPVRTGAGTYFGSGGD